MLMVIPEFDIAFEKANEINAILAKRRRSDGFVPLDEIVEAVKKVSNYSKIIVSRQSFSELDLHEDDQKTDESKYGAMLSTMTRKRPNLKKNEQVAVLIINSDYSADMQRFSVAHELGHLITHIPNFTYEQIDDDNFTISAHINPDITFISEEECQDDKYLIAEQVANIFALLVLIPQNIKIRDIKKYGIDALMRKYGVTEDAIYSRMLLSSVKQRRNDRFEMAGVGV